MQETTSKQLEEAACMSYLYCLGIVEKDMKSDQETDSKQLHTHGRRLLGKKFVGVFARDTFPFSSLKPGDMGIINTDTNNMPGEHWVAVARGVVEPKLIFVYDSFGRKNLIKPVKALPPGIKLHDVDLDPEQQEAEENCGQRSIAFLMVFRQCGEAVANLI